MVTIRFRVLSALVVTLAALLLSACGDVTVGSGSGSAGAPSTSPSPKPVRSHPGGGFQPGPTGIPVRSPRAVTIDGVIEAGVEPGCKVLTAGNTKYLILGGGDVPMGVPVRVEGTLQPGVLSTCQQGTPLRVTSVKRR